MKYSYKEPSPRIIFLAIMDGYKEMLSMLSREDNIDYMATFKSKYVPEIAKESILNLEGLLVIEFAIASKNTEIANTFIRNGVSKLISYINDNRSNIESMLDYNDIHTQSLLNSIIEIYNAGASDLSKSNNLFPSSPKI